jgi:hypothetical protein
MINRAVAIHTFQQHHWIRISVLGVILLWVFLTANGLEKFPLVSLTPVLVWVLGCGTIGRDMSSGVSHLLFTRPITRFSYVLTKWASLVAATWAFQVLVLVVWAFGTLCYRNDPEFNLWTIQHLLLAMWMAATLSTVVILYSSIMPGWGDLGLLFFVHVTLGVLGMVATTSRSPVMGEIIKGLLEMAWPGVSGESFFREDKWPTLDHYLLHSFFALAYLAAAFWIMSRKDITYTAE